MLLRVATVLALVFPITAHSHDDDDIIPPLLNFIGEVEYISSVVGVSFFGPNLEPSLLKDATAASEKLSKILKLETTPHINYYNQRFGPDEAPFHRAVAMVQFSIKEDIEHEPLPAIEFKIMSDAKVISKRMDFRVQFPAVRTATHQLPDGSIAEETYMQLITEYRVLNYPTIVTPFYRDFATCQSRREGAEQLIAKDPKKKVFWSTCHYAERSPGFYLIVHYVDTGDGA